MRRQKGVGEREAAVARALAYIRSAQQQNGSFASLLANDLRCTTPKSARTVFLPAMLLRVLAGMPDAAAANICKPLATWLRTQQEANGAFNYWARGASQRLVAPYPNDLDDTCTTLAALYIHSHSLVGGKELAQAVKLLLAAETAVGGPYRTWLVTPDAPKIWQDVDLAVNSNIAYFLNLVAEPLPSLTAYMDAAITTRAFISPYYPSSCHVAYFVTKAYRGLLNRQLAQFWYEQLGTATLDSQQLAFCISSLAQLGQSVPETAVERLLDAQRADGSWPASPLCVHAVKGARREYMGSAAMSTAFAVEALTLQGRQRISGRKTKQMSPMVTAVSQQAATAIAGLPGSLQADCQQLLTQFTNSQTIGEIVRLPVVTAHSCAGQPPARDMLERLGVANLYGWMAYALLDDVLDGDRTPQVLPAATTLMRLSLQSFTDVLPTHRTYQRLVYRLFNTIDAANAWELQHCRMTVHGGSVHIGTLPRFAALGTLADRSTGHALPVMGVLAVRGVPLSGVACSRVLQGLRHFLIARQLSDDLHDWEEDIARGRVSAVVARIRTDAHISTGKHQTRELITQLRPVFWHKSLPKLVATAQKHITLSRRAFRTSGLVLPGSPLARITEGVDASLAKTIAEYKTAQAFLKRYKHD